MERSGGAFHTGGLVGGNQHDPARHIHDAGIGEHGGRQYPVAPVDGPGCICQFLRLRVF